MERFENRRRRIGIRHALNLCLALSLWAAVARPLAAADLCVIVNGLGGLPEYEENFVEWSDRLEKLCGSTSQAKAVRFDGRETGREQILEGFRQASASLAEGDRLWLFLIGHANHDGERFKLHIRGPDLTDLDLLRWLKDQAGRKVYLIAATSASGALLGELAGDNRVLVTATRNRMERQPPLFLSFFLEAAESAEADSDKNGRVSLLEAFQFSRSRVAAWFQEKGRLQTEHPVLDDGGRIRIGEKDDGPEAPATGEGMLSASASLSAPSEKSYRSLEAKALADQRQAVERDIEDLKFRKGELSSDEYYDQLQTLLVKLATINQEIERLEAGS